MLKPTVLVVTSSDVADATDIATVAAAVALVPSDKSQDGNRTTSISELDSLRQLVSNQQHEINRLQSRLNFVLSFLGISEGDSTIPIDGNLDTNSAAEGRTRDYPQMPGLAFGSSSVDPSVSCEQWNTVVSKLLN